MTPQDKVLIKFHRWMASEGWQYHDSGGYWFKLEYESQWPPKESNTASEDQLIDLFKVYCMTEFSKI